MVVAGGGIVVVVGDSGGMVAVGCCAWYSVVVDARITFARVRAHTLSDAMLLDTLSLVGPATTARMPRSVRPSQ